MVDITKEDCFELQRKFNKYCETAEQHEFIKLFVIDEKLQSTIDCIKSGSIDLSSEDSKSNINAMFRVILKVIGEDTSAYKEE